MSNENTIVVVGIGCRTPGADNTQEFWELLKRGECMITDVPPDRWNAAAYLDTDSSTGAFGKAYVQKGGFVKDIYGFDNALYDIKEFEAIQMDPQQRMLLDCTYMAMQDAGINRTDIWQTNTGVFVGCMNNDHATSYLASTSKTSSVSTTGCDMSVLPGRLSYVFNLLGPSMMIDTACSSSLIALHLACQAIRAGDCDMAICGGVNCMILPEMYVQLCKAGMLSPTGLCHTFSDQADGYIRGEGCGVVILKWLKDALRDGNNILATVVGTCNNQDGRTATSDGGRTAPLSAPSGSQQVKLLTSVYRKAGVDVTRLDYIEAHGTGTATGDPVEVNALREFLRTEGGPRDRYIGSLKTNIGHTESAAGILSVIKLVLMMKHNMIVPSLHCHVVNPRINLTDCRFIIPKQAVPWPNKEKLAGCSGYGVGGSNCHVALASYSPSNPTEARATRRTSYVVCFSAKTERSLKASMQDIVDNSEAGELDVRDLSYTSTVRRDHYRCRAAFVVGDVQELLSKVQNRLDNNVPLSTRSDPGVVFVFCGMGTDWLGMCRELMLENKVFGDKLLQVEGHFKHYVSWSLTERLQQQEAFQDPVFVPMAIFACQVSLAAVWEGLGVKPRCVLGQSVGEVAAALTAGCLTLADAVKVIYERSTALAQVTGGGMVLVRFTEVDAVRTVLSEMDTTAAISQEYSPTACAVSARSEDIESLKTELEERLREKFPSLRLQDLKVSVAYHSHHVSPCVEKLRQSLSGMSASRPRIPLISTVTGAVLDESPGISYWLDNVRKPVLFRQAVVEAKKISNSSTSKSSTADSPLFLEIGPTAILKAHLNDLFPGEACTAVPSMSQQGEVHCFLQAVASLYEQGAEVSWKQLPTQGTRIAAFPRYVFDKKQLKEMSEVNAVFLLGADLPRKTHLFVFPIKGSSLSFGMVITPLSIPSVYDHVISGKVVVPGALYAESAFAVAVYKGLKQPVAISVEFEHAAIITKNEVLVVNLQLDTPTESGRHWQHQLTVKHEGRHLATLRIAEASPSKQETISLYNIRSQCKDRIDKKEIYRSLQELSFTYGPSFKLLEEASRNASASECLALLELNDLIHDERPGTTIHPSILDCMLQSSILVLSRDSGTVTNVLPKSFGKLVVYGQMESSMLVYTRRKQPAAHGTFVFDIKLLTEGGQVIAELSEFVVQSLTPKDSPQIATMLTTTWRKVSTMRTEEKSKLKQKLLLITDTDTAPQVNHLAERYDWRVDTPEKVTAAIENKGDVSAVVLFYSGVMDDEVQGQSVQSCVLNMCCIIQHVLKILNVQRVPPVFCLCTFNAWAPLDGETRPVRVNPVAMALWGLLRTFVIETSPVRAVSLELHTAQEPPTVTLAMISSIQRVLCDEGELTGFSEVLLNDEGVFVNEILIAAENYETPSKRLGHTVKMRDIAEDAVFLSEDPVIVVNALALQVSTPFLTERGNEKLERIQVDAFTQPPVELFRLKVSSGGLLPERESSCETFIVMATEATGVIMLQSHTQKHPQSLCGNLPSLFLDTAVSDQDLRKTEVVVCFPMAVSREIHVPASATLPKALIPSYVVGDVSKLVLLRSLFRQLPEGRVTILASSATQQLADVLKLMCQDRPSSWPAVRIVCLENVQDVTQMEEVVLSLVTLEESFTSLLMEKWKSASCLVTLTCLVSSDLVSLLTVVKPQTEIRLVDTQRLYQASELKRVVPDVRQWTQEHEKDMSAVARALHSGGQTTSDIWRLLQFKSCTLGELEVRVEQRSLFRVDGSYIVVGGLTGLGWLCVEFLARNHAGYIAIFNRRKPSDERLQEMNTLHREFGCRVQSYQVDVTSMTSLEQALQSVRTNSSQCRLRGVFFGAAVTEDGAFTELKKSSFDSVLSPKVKGAWNLHRLTRDLPLDYFVLHSSVASFLGNRGQANYSAGNAFLDGLAFYRRQQNLEAQTINWGPLDTGLLENRDAVKEKLKRSGFELTSGEEVKNTLDALLHHNWSQSCPVKLDTDIFSQRMVDGGLKRMQSRHATPTSSSGVHRTIAVELQKFRHMEPAERLIILENYVRELASGLVGVDSMLVSRDTNLADLGLDSVTGMEMISWIQRDTTFRLQPVDVVAGEVTVGNVAAALDGLVNTDQVNN